MNIDGEISVFANWLNGNQGVLALALFAISFAFARFGKIISALRRRTRLDLSLIPGPTLCVVDDLGRDELGRSIHRVSISLYLKVMNSGSAPTSIGSISVGYKWSVRPFAIMWWKQIFSVHWIEYQTIALTDFQTIISSDGDLKIFPFLTQKSAISGSSANTYLEVGEITNGIVYFEQPDAWGACQPLNKGGYSKMRVRVHDAFGRKHFMAANVPLVDAAEAKKYNPSFGDSLNKLKNV